MPSVLYQDVTINPTVYRTDSDPSATREELNLLRITCDSQESRINISQRVHACLKEHDVLHIWNADSHGYDGTEWSKDPYLPAQRFLN
jgi:hypothetical protein